MNQPLVNITQKDKEKSLKFNKDLCVRIDVEVQAIKLESPRWSSPERTLALRSLQQAGHWLREDLRILGSAKTINETPVPEPVAPISLPPEACPPSVGGYDVAVNSDGSAPQPTAPEPVSDGKAREEANQEELAAPSSGHQIISGMASVATQ
jgi:hypothetical protein